VPRRVGKKEGSTSVNPFWINIAGAKNEQNICRGREPTGDRVRCCSTGKSVNQEVLHRLRQSPKFRRIPLHRLSLDIDHLPL
jgi:hypothetical protein